MIKIGVRWGIPFDVWGDLDRWGAECPVGMGIELALPHILDSPDREDTYTRFASRMPALADVIRRHGIKVLSIHGCHGSAADERFLTWGREHAILAKAVGAHHIVLHPRRCDRKGRMDRQELARRQIRRLEHETEVGFAVETFLAIREFRHDEIVPAGMKVVLDTSHVTHDQALALVGDGRARALLAGVHLSERGDGPEGDGHLPIGDHCREVVAELVRHDWSGPVILEYLPEFHDRVVSDAIALREFVSDLAARY